MSQNVLMVTKFVPYPANTGGKRRSLAVLDQYLKRGDRVTLVAHEDDDSDSHELERRGVRVISKPWSRGIGRVLKSLWATQSGLLGRFYSADLHRRAFAAAREDDFDVLQIEYLQNAIYADLPARVRVLDLHDVVSEQTKRIGSVQPLPLRLLYEAESARVRWFEKSILSRFDVVACVSGRDAQLLGGDRILVARNGWDETPPLPVSSEDVVAFTGNFSFSVNVDAALHFTSQIWPKVRQAIPGAQLLLVGRDPALVVKKLHGIDNVHVTGTVNDVRPFLQRARVTVVPLRAGSGSRLKILESLEASRPVVSTSIGMEGLEPLRGEGTAVVDGPQDFADAVVRLLKDRDLACAWGERGRIAVHREYLWRNTLGPLFDAIDEQLASMSERSSPSGVWGIA